MCRVGKNGQLTGMMTATPTTQEADNSPPVATVAVIEKPIPRPKLSTDEKVTKPRWHLKPVSSDSARVSTHALP